LCRLFQNKKSAQKCRLKKALEFEHLVLQVEQLKKENTQIKEKLTEVNMLLLAKTEENMKLNQKMESNQVNQTLLLT